MMVAAEGLVGPTPRERAGELARHLPAGLWLGAATGTMWAFLVLLPVLIIPHAPPAFETIGPPIVLTVVLASWIGGGIGFARTVHRRLGSRPSRLSTVVGGVACLGATFVGLVFALAIEHSAVEAGGVDRALLPLVFTAAFAPALAGLVLALALAVGASLRIEGAVRRALAAAAVTALVYVAIALPLNLLPGWRVGGGQRAMVKGALVANLLTGIVGGTAASWLLTRGSRLPG